MNLMTKMIDFLINSIDFTARLFPLKKQIVFESNPDFSDNTFFLYKKMIEYGYNKKYKMYWILGDERSDYDLPENVYTIKRNLGSPSEKIKYRWVKGRSRYIIDCNRYIMKTSSDQTRIHLKHGLPMKDVPEYNFNIGDVDLISVPSEYWIERCAEEHNTDKSLIVPLGFPRNDVLKPCDHENINIIWMPTWISNRNSSTEEEREKNILVSEMPFGLPCLKNYEQLEQINGIFKENNAYLYIRLHPMQDSPDLLINNMSNIIICNDKFLNDNNVTLYEFLCRTDALISDYSSVYYDYLKLDKPIALIIKYYKEYKENCGLIKYSCEEFKKNFPSNFINSYEELLEFFNFIFSGKDPVEADRKEAMQKYMPCTDSDSADNIINYMKEHFDF